MHTLKDKVTGKLSNLFSDTPDQIQAWPKDGKSVSSIFSYILPAASFDVFRSNKQISNIKSIDSQPIRWNSKSLLQIEKPLDSYVEYDIKCEKKAGQKSHEEDGDYFSGRSTASRNIEMLLTCEENGEHGSGRSTSSETFEDVADSHSSERSMPNLTDDSSFIYSELYEFFQSYLPNIVKGCQWVLLYSTVRDGISLRTLLRKSANVSGPCLLITGDKQGAVFGGLLECPLTPTAKRKYQGTNQAFVFTTIYGEPRLFRPTGANRCFYLCLNDLLALGGGGKFALSLDGDLLTGTSGSCDTFGNLCLAHSQEFELKNVEVWGFTHVSKYLG